jgi:hypothetical protein
MFEEDNEQKQKRHVDCPNCGSKALTSLECLSCGLILSKWTAVRTGPITAKEPLPGVRENFSPLDKSVSRAWELIRLGLGVISLILAWVLYSNGKALHAFELYFVVVVYGGMGVWIIATFPNRLNMRQFLIEMCFVGLVTIPTILVDPMLYGWESDMETMVLPMSDLELEQGDENSSDFDDILRRYLLQINRFISADAPVDRNPRNRWIVGAHGPRVVRALNDLDDNDPRKSPRHQSALRQLLDHLERISVSSWVQVGDQWNLQLEPAQVLKTRALLDEVMTLFGLGSATPDENG